MPARPASSSAQVCGSGTAAVTLPPYEPGPLGLPLLSTTAPNTVSVSGVSLLTRAWNEKSGRPSSGKKLKSCPFRLAVKS